MSQQFCIYSSALSTEVCEKKSSGHKIRCLVWWYLGWSSKSLPQTIMLKDDSENPPNQVKPRYVASICVLKKLIYSLIYEITNETCFLILFVVIGRFIQFYSLNERTLYMAQSAFWKFLQCHTWLPERFFNIIGGFLKVFLWEKLKTG